MSSTGEPASANLGSNEALIAKLESIVSFTLAECAEVCDKSGAGYTAKKIRNKSASHIVKKFLANAEAGQ